jgi:hypothetical protein
LLCAAAFPTVATATERIPTKKPVAARTKSLDVASGKFLLTPTLAARAFDRMQRDTTADMLKPAPPSSVTTPPNACNGNASVVCYDYRSGRAVIGATRQLMPPVPGLKAESITLKRNRLALNYSF